MRTIPVLLLTRVAITVSDGALILSLRMFNRDQAGTHYLLILLMTCINTCAECTGDPCDASWLTYLALGIKVDTF